MGFKVVEIYQIADIEHCSYAFMGYNIAEKMVWGYQTPWNGKEWLESTPIYGVHIEDYKLAYKYDEWMDEIEDEPMTHFLERIFEKFNVDCPADYEGRSLSVSDMVRIDEESWYYVDTMGFKHIGDFEEGFKDTDFRICDECGAVMTDGFVIDGGEAYYCSEDCLHKHYTQEEYEAMYDDDGETYWTAWY